MVNRSCWLPADNKLNDPDGWSSNPYNADLSKESEHAAEFQIHVRHSREEKTGACHGGLLSGSYCKEIKELFTLAWPTVLSYFFLPHDSHDQLVFCWACWQTRIGCWNIALSFINVTDLHCLLAWFSSRDTLFSSIWSEELSLVGVVLQRGVWILGLTCILAWSLWVNTELLLLLVQQEETVARYVLFKETADTCNATPNFRFANVRCCHS